MLKKIVYVLFSLMLFVYLMAAYTFTSLMLVPKGTKLSQTEMRMKKRSGFDFQRVFSRDKTPIAFETTGADETIIRGWYYQKDDPDCAIVFSHGWTTNRSGAMKYKYLFDDCGCDMVFYDHRAHNESEGQYGTGGVLERNDLLAVTDWLQDQNGLPDSKTALVGASWGGATVLQAGGISERQFAFILSDSPFQDWHTAITERADKWYGSWTRIFTPAIALFVKLRTGTNFFDASAIRYMANISSPVFLIHSEGDEATSSHQSENLSQYLNSKSEFHHTGWGSGHTLDITHQSTKYKQLLDKFIETKVPSFKTCPVQVQ